MFSYRTGAAGAPSSAAAMGAYLSEPSISADRAQTAAYYAQDSREQDGLAAGMGAVPLPRRDLDPALAAALGIDPDHHLSAQQFAHVLTGLRADGTPWPCATRPMHYKASADEHGLPIGKDRVSIAYVDMVFSAPKSVSVAWALAPDDQKLSIAQAHRDARDQALAYVETQIAKRGFGDGHATSSETGRMAWVTCDHYTSRPTIAVRRSDPQTGVVDTELHTLHDKRVPGDMQLHSHCIVPNLMHMESGRMIAINRDLLKSRVHEFGAVYQAFLTNGLRTRGFDAGLDARTGMGFMPAVPLPVVTWFSKRHRDSEALARNLASGIGQDWDRLDGTQRVQFMRNGAILSRQSKGDSLLDMDAWKNQATDLGYDPESFLAYGPPQASKLPEARLDAALSTALPYLSDDLVKRAVVTDGDVRAAAARGLIEHGIDSGQDVSAVTRLMARGGVLQEGQDTRLIWRLDDRGSVKITTELHKAQEEGLIALAKSAAGDTRLALPTEKIEAAVVRSGLDFNNEHGAAQRAAIEVLGSQGGLAVLIGSAGVGKTRAIIPPLVDAWRQEGHQVWGVAMAWRQAKELAQGGIEAEHCRALDPFLKAAAAGDIVIDGKSVIVLDELGQVGTRQLLDLLRLREATGAKVVALGDDRQCQSIQAGPVIDLLRRALGPDAIPEILTTVRQQSEEERRIVGMFRDGQVGRAIAAKRAQGTAELAPGGYQQAVERVANLHAELRIAHPGSTVSVSAPTNADAREISLLIRQARREMGEVGPDLATVKASDGRGEAYEMAVAVGDKVRLYQQVRGAYVDAKGRTRSGVIGDNGSVLKVVSVLPGQGFRLEAESGHVGFVTLDGLKHRGSDALAMTYGDCATIDSSQGITSDHHIHAFPSGSKGVNGFKNYVALTRARHQSFMVGSAGAELAGAIASRPMGLPRPEGQDAHDQAWAHMVANLSKVPVKESALAMLEGAATRRRTSARTMQEGLHRQARGRAVAPKVAGAGAKADAARAARATLQQAKRSMRPASQRPKAKTETDPVQADSAAAFRPSEQKRPPMTAVEAQAEFADMLHRAGLRPRGPPVMDGKMHRVAVEGDKRGKQSGSYIGHLDGLPAGYINNFKTGQKETWRASGPHREMTGTERTAEMARVAADRAAREAARREAENDAAQKAASAMQQSISAAAEHPYLVRKAIQVHGLRQDRSGNLLVPMQSIDGKLWGLQKIAADGAKLFAKGGRKDGTFAMLGTPKEGEPLLFAEGVATAATVREATGYAVVVAFDASNLQKVVQAFRAQQPGRQVIIMADNDHHLLRREPPLPNTGAEKGRAAADEVGGILALPAFRPDDKGTDWNDYEAQHGREGLRALLGDILRDHGLELPPLPVISQTQRDAARQKSARSVADAPGAVTDAAARDASRRAQQGRQSGHVHGA